MFKKEYIYIYRDREPTVGCQEGSDHCSHPGIKHDEESPL